MSFQLNFGQLRALRNLAQALDYAENVELTDKVDVSPYKPKAIEDARKVVAEVNALVSHPVITDLYDVPMLFTDEGNWIPEAPAKSSKLVCNVMTQFAGTLVKAGDPRRFGGELALFVPENQIGILQEVTPGDHDCNREPTEECISTWSERIKALQIQYPATTLYLAHDEASFDGNLVIGAFTPLVYDRKTLFFDEPYGDEGQTIAKLSVDLNDMVKTLSLVTPDTNPVDPSIGDSSLPDLNW